MRRWRHRSGFFGAADLPVVDADGLWARVVAGSAFGEHSPVGYCMSGSFAEVVIGRVAQQRLYDPDYEERAIYLVEGEVEIAGDRFRSAAAFDLPSRRSHCCEGDRALRNHIPRAAGALEGPRHIWWNFVSSRRESNRQKQIGN